MRLPSPLRWLRTRNAAIASRRVDHAARVKGVVGIEDQTPDDLSPLADPLCTCPWNNGYHPRGTYGHHISCAALRPGHWIGDECDPPNGLVGHIDTDDLMAVADGVAETLCCHRWDVDPDVDSGVHTVQHLCVVAIPSHGYHECACGVWRLEIGATP